MINLMPDSQDPTALLDYAYDWTSYLEEGETITDYEIDPGTLTASQEANTDSKVTVWFTGGVAASFAVTTCSITTSKGRNDIRTMTIRIEKT